VNEKMFSLRSVHCNPSESSPAAKNSERGSVSRSMFAGSSSFVSLNVSWTRGRAAAHRAALRIGCGCAALRSFAVRELDGLSGLPADLLLDVGLGNRAFGGAEGAALDDVPEFANIAGPGVKTKRLQRRRGEAHVG